MKLRHYFGIFSLALSVVYAATPSGKTYKDYTEYRDSFTDSQGRTAEYAFSLPAGHNSDSAAAILVYLHGNNQVTQSEIIDMFMNKANSLADKYRSFIPVIMTSPETRVDGITRQWSYEFDPTFVREMIDGHFENQLKVDFSKVYFYGASQGSCFLHAMMMQKMEALGGGVFAACGCNDFRDPYWEPSQETIDNFRMYLQSSAGDFLNTPAHEAFEFYKYSTKLETLADLDRAGGHCDIDDEVEDLAIRFITRLDSYVPSIDPVHLKRIKVIAEGYKITNMINEKKSNDLIFVQSKKDSSIIQKSVNQGIDFSLQNTLLDSIVELEIEDEKISAQGLNKKYSDINNAINFSNLNFTDKQRIKVDFNGEGFVELNDSKELRFVNATQNDLMYTRFPDALFDHNNFKNPDSALAQVAYAGEYLPINSKWQYSLIRINNDKTTKIISLDSVYNDFMVSANKNNIVLFGGLNPSWDPTLIYSDDRGESWQKIPFPTDITSFYSNYDVYLSTKNEIVLTGMNKFYKSNDLGQNWETLPNSSYLNLNGFVEDRDNILYAYSDRAIYRFDLWTSDNIPLHSNADNITPEIKRNIFVNDLEWNQKSFFKYQLIENSLFISGKGLIEVSVVDAKGRVQALLKRSLNESELKIALPPKVIFEKTFIKIKHQYMNNIFEESIPY